MSVGIPHLSLAGSGYAFWIGLSGLACLGALAVVLLALFYGKTWLQAYMSNAKVSLSHLIGMSFRQVRTELIVKSKIVLAQAGIDDVHTSELEAHYLAGGDLENVVLAVVAANRSGIDLHFDRASAIDLAGRNVLDAVRTSVSPRVIYCPDPDRSTPPALSAVAKDGIELRIQARVTVRTNMDSLIGGATEATVIARVGQGIISAVGSANAHADVLCAPEEISKQLIRQRLDSNTAYRIVSIDIARIDVGNNIGARIRTDQAEADMRVSQSLSEGRRAQALALRQEMQALIKRREADLVLAESFIPFAIGDAVRKGSIGSCDSSDGHLIGGFAFHSANESSLLFQSDLR